MATGEWGWQGFFGAAAAVAAAKVTLDNDVRVGVWVPLQGEPPRAVDKSGVMAMFAVQTRADAQVPCPAGLLEADPGMVGRLVGA
jgi:hypothetical protein